MSIPAYTRLKIVGDISVQPVTEKLPDDGFIYLLWGPTGAGKSCGVPYTSKFIQALAGDSQDLGISKDQLAGCTQTAAAYKVVNVLLQEEERDRPIYVIDTPGFSDPQISSLGVFISGEAIRSKKGSVIYDKILFITPINQTRMPGTKRRTIDTLKTMLQPSKDRSAFTIVTTRWDTLHTESANQRAESNYEQLRDEFFKEFGDMGATIARFANTRDSALEILDMGPWVNDGRANIRTTMTSLYQDLHERIDALLQRKKDIQSELADPLAQTNNELGAILEKDYAENEELITKFVKELLGIPFLPPEYEEARYGLIKSLLVSYTIPRTMPVRFFIIHYQLTRLARRAKRRGAKWFRPTH